MKSIQDIMKLWGVSLTDFEKWPGNNLGGFRVYRSLKERFSKPDGHLDKDKAFTHCWNKAYENLMSDFKNLRLLKYEWLLDHTKKYLKEASYLFMQNMLNNKNVWIKTNSSSITTGQFTASRGMDNFILDRDIYDLDTRKAIKASGITKYVIEDYDANAKLIFDNNDGSLQFIGWFDLDKHKELL